MNEAAYLCAKFGCYQSFINVAKNGISLRSEAESQNIFIHFQKLEKEIRRFTDHNG
jgi:hypothetical protein